MNVKFFKEEQLPYISSCTSDGMCQTGLGLYCSTTGNLCNCPTTLGSGKCDCTASQYYQEPVGCGKPPLMFLGFLKLIYNFKLIKLNSEPSVVRKCLHFSIHVRAKLESSMRWFDLHM